MRNRLASFIGAWWVALALAALALTARLAVPCCAGCYCWPSSDWCLVIICPWPFLVLRQ